MENEPAAAPQPGQLSPDPAGTGEPVAPGVTPAPAPGGAPPAAPAPAAGQPAAPAAPAAGQPAAPSAAPAAGAPTEPGAPAAPAAPPADPNASWRAGIVDPALKNIADRIASPTDAVGLIRDLRTEISQRIKLPGEGASAEDTAKFRKAIGVPESIEGYDLSLPDGVEMNDADKAVLDMIVPIAHETGVPNKTFNAFVNKFMELNRASEAQFNQQLQQAQTETVNTLKREWGGEYDKNVNLANRVGEVLGGQDFKKFLNETVLPGGGALGDHPQMVRFLATMGRRTDEGELMLGATPEERTSVQTELDELNKAVPPGSPGYTQPDHQKKLQELYEKLYGRNTIVGGTGRAA